MLQEKIKEILLRGRGGAEAARDRVRTGLAGRSRQVVAMATLAGVAAIGLTAATLDNSPADNSTATSADAHNERLAAQGRVNRAVRESVAPQALAAVPGQSGTPTATTPATTPVPAAPKKAPDWVSPMAAPVSSCFGPRWGTQHAGVDLAGNAGEPIVAVGAGEVFGAGWIYSGYGISVVVDHGDGYLTHYAHMQETAVSPGQRVKAGDILGYEGSTGDSTGPHLHFEVHQGMWHQIEPAQWLRDRGVDLGSC